VNGQPKTGRSGASVIVRSIVWIVVSSFFVFRAGRIISVRHSVGLGSGWWLWGQVVVWSAAMLFWLVAGWRDLSHRDSPERYERGVS